MMFCRVVIKSAVGTGTIGCWNLEIQIFKTFNIYRISRVDRDCSCTGNEGHEVLHFGGDLEGEGSIGCDWGSRCFTWKTVCFYTEVQDNQTALIRYFDHLAPFLNMQIKPIGSARQSNLCQWAEGDHFRTIRPHSDDQTSPYSRQSHPRKCWK